MEWIEVNNKLFNLSKVKYITYNNTGIEIVLDCGSNIIMLEKQKIDYFVAALRSKLDISIRVYST